MTLFVAWAVFPLVLGALCLGCGLALERASGVALPGALLLPAGFAVVSLVAQFALLFGPTVRLATPAVVALAVAGLALSLPLAPRRLVAWATAAATGVYGVFAAPVVLSGRATFAGYIKLDDTATYLAMLDRAMQHGYDVAGLAPSTYDATLNTSLAYGYPLGSLLPLGVARTLVRENTAWLWQPYLTFLAALLALAVYQLTAGLVRSSRLRAAVAFVGAQAALIYGYALWGGVKELTAAVLLALAAALVPATAAGLARPRAALPLAAACAAVMGALSVGGAVWLVPVVVATLALAHRPLGARRLIVAATAFLLAVGFLAIPSFVAAVTWLSHSGAFTGSSEVGNLVGRLDWIQVFGIWPGGDFRRPPVNTGVTDAAIVLCACGVAFALATAWRRRSWALPVAAATAAFGCLLYVGEGSPWVGGKALASASPLVLALGLAGVAAAVERRALRLAGSVAGALLAAAVLWSNVLQYHAVSLAPSQALAELATIGSRFDADGPALMTDYQSYGVRHFLRGLDAEGASELRRDAIPLRTGAGADTGVSADIDEFELAGVLHFRTLVLRRSALASRPPSVYKLVYAGRYYDVWQRPQGNSRILEHLSLGTRWQPAAVPACSAVERLARLAAAHGGMLATVERPAAIVVEPDGTVGPPAVLGPYGQDPLAPYATRAFTVATAFSVTVPGDYGVWIGGTVRARTEVVIDGRRVGVASDEVNWPSTYAPLGQIELGRGRHSLALDYAGPGFAPGTGGTPVFGLGPIAIGIGTGEWPVTYVSPAHARSLCGKTLDWIEALSHRGRADG